MRIKSLRKGRDEVKRKDTKGRLSAKHLTRRRYRINSLITILFGERILLLVTNGKVVVRLKLSLNKVCKVYGQICVGSRKFSQTWYRGSPQLAVERWLVVNVGTVV